MQFMCRELKTCDYKLKLSKYYLVTMYTTRCSSMKRNVRTECEYKELISFAQYTSFRCSLICRHDMI